MNEAGERAGDNVDPCLQKANDILDGLLRLTNAVTEIGKAIELQREHFLDRIGRLDTGIGQPDDFPGVTPRVIRPLHQQPDEFQPRMADNAAQPLPSGTAGSPMYNTN